MCGIVSKCNMVKFYTDKKSKFSSKEYKQLTKRVNESL